MEYYVIDTETTGFRQGFHEITQISIVRCSDRHQLSKYIAAEFPERANYKALEVTGRSISDIVQGESKKKATKAFDDFLLEDKKTNGHRCMVAHNAAFDRRFVHALWGELGKTFPATLWLCTQTMTRRYIKKYGIKSKVNLEASLKAAKIKNVRLGAHNAIVDTQNTYKLWKGLIDKYNIDYLPIIKTWPHK